MAGLTQEQKETFLSELHVGVLSIARENRGPLTAPIWYCYEPGGNLWVMLGRESRKAQLLEVGTRVSLCAQKEEPPYAYVTAEGPVVGIAEGTHADILELASRYVGEEGGKAYAENMRTAESLTVTIRPETWLAVDYASQQ
ncbi:MAG: pyridoxamine 5'-phosphate oxidase [Gammaproteobacteria bacterium]|nr:pyridoxamine 5'-phosphate oxidase [Gammaproteobacteria bacterium]MYE81409.1 pyridoxamine 5'-phosphate oxidase [Gammaproteobacteria bacterium]